MKKEMFTVGARGSALSLAQTAGALDFLRARFPGTDYRVVTVETPGDRDLTTPIEKSAPDFFTRDLDEAVREGRVDFAVHSAKDLPPKIADDLDWFWLPERADPRDCWVVRAGGRAGARPSRIGVSSERRAAYAKKIYPKAKLLPIRGSIDSRIQQLRDGRYDAVLMALAGITRLYGVTPPGVELIPIPLDELTPPEAQGYLAVVFRAGDTRLIEMRAHFVKAVRFVSAGVGDAGLCTLQGRQDIAAADIVLHDALFDLSLLGQRTEDRGQRIDVGKRCGAHSMQQAEITRMICDEARKGRRVVRLKGGDAGLFGRLAEETDALTALGIPFVVRPGVSALVAATTGTGLLLTRRGESRGFTAYTPRSTGMETPQVAFMATRMASDEARRLVREGWTKTTPCAFVFDAAGPCEEVRTATLGTVRKILPAKEEDRPGLFIVGRVAAHSGWPRLGVLAGRRMLVTCSDAVQKRAATAVEDLGGRPIRWPLIELRATRTFGDEVADYDAIVLTSPSAVRIFFANCTCDLRRLGAFYTCGAGTDAELRRHGIASDVLPAKDFSAAGLAAEIKRLDLHGKRVLRLRSAKAGTDVARALRRAGAKVDDVVLYANEACAPEGTLPPFDDVFFASASAVESFLARYGAGALRGKGVFVMGGPTRRALPKSFSAKARIFDIMTATISGTVPVKHKEKR
jgi:uroporphyrinogen III methyltransferase/synthase